MSVSPFIRGERARAIAWKQATRDLPDAARVAADYYAGEGRIITGPFDYCLPPAHVIHNLLPDARGVGMDMFERLSIPWHAGVGTGPGNHLLDSQVQCVNALAPLTHSPDKLSWLFGRVLPIQELLPIELGAYVTFEWIGLTDHLHEGQGALRRRGSHATSADAAIRYRSTEGGIEVGLIEWKYREDYTDPRHLPDAATTERRMVLRRPLWDAPDCPLRHDAIKYGTLFLEPRYQLFRLQVLATRMERAHELDGERVRLVVAVSGRNRALASDLARWPTVLHHPDRFRVVDTDRLLDRHAPSSEHYRQRYGA